MTLTSGDDNIAAFKKSTITDRTDLTMVTVGEILWEPSPEWVEQTNLNAFRQWLKENRNVEFDDLHQMRRWSLDHLDDFWQAAWDYFDIERIITSKLQYSANALCREHNGFPAQL